MLPTWYFRLMETWLQPVRAQKGTQEHPCVHVSPRSQAGLTLSSMGGTHTSGFPSRTLSVWEHKESGVHTDEMLGMAACRQHVGWEELLHLCCYFTCNGFLALASASSSTWQCCTAQCFLQAWLSLLVIEMIHPTPAHQCPPDLLSLSLPAVTVSHSLFVLLRMVTQVLAHGHPSLTAKTQQFACHLTHGWKEGLLVPHHF